jgi:hypothetical protein
MKRMSDIRVCSICGLQFDKDSLPPDIRIVEDNDLHFTFLTERGYGVCHTLMSAVRSAEQSERVEDAEYKVRVPEPGSSEATIEGIIESEQPINFDEIFATPAEPLVVESEAEPESASSETDTEFAIDYGVEIDARVVDVPRRQGGYGFAEMPDRFRHKSPSFVWFHEDIETVGTIRSGSLIRAVITEPDAGYTFPRLRNIRIYQEQE